MEYCVGDKKFESYDEAMQALPRLSFCVGDKVFYDYREACDYEASLASAVTAKRYFDAMRVMAVMKPSKEVNYYFVFSEDSGADRVLEALITSVEGSKKRLRIQDCAVVDAYEIFKPEIPTLHLQSFLTKVITKGVKGYSHFGWDNDLGGDVYIVNMLGDKVSEESMTTVGADGVVIFLRS